LDAGLYVKTLSRASQRVANGIDRGGQIIYAKFTQGEREKAYNVPGPAQLRLLPLTLYLVFFTALARHFVNPLAIACILAQPDI
jgi:hypothetical protein